MLRYRRRRGWKSHVRIWTVPLIAMLCVAGFLYSEDDFQRRKQATWITSTAIAEDTRLRPIARFSLEYGSKPLYEVDVLASYTEQGQPHQDWLPLSESPQNEIQARAQANALKRRQCFVRWDPANPTQKLVELK
jgi:hypothetical protein